MNKAAIERNIVVVLFVMVLVAFSFAQRDTKKLDKLYTNNHKVTGSKLALKASNIVQPAAGTLPD